MKLIINLTLATVLTGCSIIGKTPPSSFSPIQDDPLPVSNIGIPVNINIAPIVTQLNSSVPSQFRNSTFPSETNDGNGNCIKYEVNRQPINVNGSGNTFDITSSLHYFFEAHLQAVFACFAWIACGSDNVSPYPRILNVSYRTSLNINPDYFLSSQTTDPQITPGNSCPATIFQIDIAGRIADVARGPLTQVKGQLDNFINNNSSFKPIAQKAWDELNKDIKLTDKLFLRVKPSGFYASSLNSTGHNVGVTFGVSAQPEIVTNENQNPQIPTLPNLNVGGGSNTFNIYSDIRSDYKFLSQELNNVFSNHRYPVPGQPSIYLDLQNVEAYGIGNSQITFKFTGSGKIKFKKYKKTVFYVNAQPIYDPATRALSFINVSVDTKSNDIFIKAGLRLFDLPIVEGIQSLKIQIGSIIDNGVTTLNNALNQTINSNISISGNVSNLLGLNLNPKVNEIIFRANLSGNVSLTVTP